MSSMAIEPSRSISSSRRSETITLASSRATSQRITSPSGRCAARSRKIRLHDRRRVSRAGRARDRVWWLGTTIRRCTIAGLAYTARADGLPRAPAPGRRSRPRPPQRFFTEENVDRYRDAADEAGIEELGVSEHIHRFADALEIWDHPFWREHARDDLAAYCEFVRSTDLRLGIEMDFVPGHEDRIANLLDAHDFDYVVGSVHFVGITPSTTRLGHLGGGRRSRPGLGRYFETPGRGRAQRPVRHPRPSRPGQGLGGRAPGPDRDPRFHYEPTVEAIAETGVAVEVSTAGHRKPVREIYPAPAFAEMCVEAGAVFALSSDAHEPENVGYEYERAVEEMRGWGVSELVVFERRERGLEELG